MGVDGFFCRAGLSDMPLMDGPPPAGVYVQCSCVSAAPFFGVWGTPSAISRGPCCWYGR